MNDPVALLLVIGFIEWIQQPDYGLADMIGLLALKLASGSSSASRSAASRSPPSAACRFPTDGIYPVATIAIAGARLRHRRGRPRLRPARRLPDRAGARLGARIPARRTIVSFHEGLGWVAQIGLFILLGLLVFPSDARRRRLEGAGALGGADPRRPAARGLRRDRASRPLNIRERAMLGWAGLRGATPIWLATFPVVAGVAQRRRRVRDRLLRRRHLDPDPGGQLRAAGDAASA